MCKKAELVYEVLKENHNSTMLLDEWAKLINSSLPPMWRMSKKTLGTMLYILHEQGKCVANRFISSGNIFYEVK